MADQTLKNPDPIFPTKPSSMLKNNISPSRSLDAAQGVRTSQKPTSQNKKLLTLIDSKFQAKKAMSTSAIVDSSKYSLSKTKTGHPRTTVKVDDDDNDGCGDSCKDQSKKSMKEGDKKKFCEVIIRKDDTKEEHDKFGVQKRHSVSLPLAGVVAAAGAGKRRVSFCGSHIELADVFASNGVKVLSVDMPPFMQIHAVEFARKTHDSLEKFTSKTLACAIKKVINLVNIN